MWLVRRLKPIPRAILWAHIFAQRHRRVSRVRRSCAGEGEGMRRRLFTFASLLSLLLLVATAVLWGLGHWFELWAFRDDQRGGRLVLYEAQGSFTFEANRWPGGARWQVGAQRVGASDAFTPSIGYPTTASASVRSWMGIEVIKVTGWIATPANPAMVGSSQAFPLVSVRVPFLWPATLTAILPLVWLGRYLLLRRASRPGLCPTCSYDLTGNTSGVCPECGSPVAGEG